MQQMIPAKHQTKANIAPPKKNQRKLPQQLRQLMFASWKFVVFVNTLKNYNVDSKFDLLEN